MDVDLIKNVHGPVINYYFNDQLWQLSMVNCCKEFAPSLVSIDHLVNIERMEKIIYSFIPRSLVSRAPEVDCTQRSKFQNERRSMRDSDYSVIPELRANQ